MKTVESSLLWRSRRGSWILASTNLLSLVNHLVCAEPVSKCFFQPMQITLQTQPTVLRYTQHMFHFRSGRKYISSCEGRVTFQILDKHFKHHSPGRKVTCYCYWQNNSCCCVMCDWENTSLWRSLSHHVQLGVLYIYLSMASFRCLFGTWFDTRVRNQAVSRLAKEALVSMFPSYPVQELHCFIIFFWIASLHDLGSGKWHVTGALQFEPHLHLL